MIKASGFCHDRKSTSKAATKYTNFSIALMQVTTVFAFHMKGKNQLLRNFKAHKTKFLLAAVKSKRRTVKKFLICWYHGGRKLDFLLLLSALMNTVII